MTDHDVDSEASHSALQQVAADFAGTVPNLYRTLDRHPLSLEAFVQLEHLLERHGRLPPDEQALVVLEVAVYNACIYCQGVFSKEAARAGVDNQTIAEVVAGRLPGQLRYRYLLEATRRIMELRGCLGRAEVGLFEERGVSHEDLLEIITIISTFTLATYANNLLHTRVDPEYR
ncbi:MULTISPECIES: carboxymuconolactone decarboxylase family protein [Ectothiorhodospira]|uniref:carboxymuconolactone decarboxylase family protein n=1 Tax=Ectothiorhodospira TaxID=1051 RepID=UPI00068461EA|nr:MULTISPECIES: carboxymuconolactone decarboxylase family protein [Ectothiorhodospira]MCG5495493.1 carboxymuconolactone decarboxylase family protein [Ectothiorhodospira variabilis]MCG5499115.1 carboxymuconolactone decarboxylase family protein [Ectothiorhodospira variabilis]MCG5503898.1 carboxymuconolactone decarboxylase family protein [Ectothiorhodospira variabilis]MCG5506971.1 carboxymuconolactone decarboxylase family protein [Ectothiorhodospira variabilis]